MSFKKRISLFVLLLLILSYIGSSCFFGAVAGKGIAKWENSRIYFTANGENIDITDQFSEEVPFLYEYTENNGTIHYIGVGGEPEKDKFGWLEITIKNGKNKTTRVVGSKCPQVEAKWEKNFYLYLEKAEV